MKRFPLLLSLLFILAGSSPLWAQVPQAIHYQAVVRDGAQVLSNSPLSVEFSISSSGQLLYQETHSLSTNAYGLIVTNIGEGTPLFGQFDSLDWATGNLELAVQADLGNGPVSLGSERFLTVPYAFMAQKALSVTKMSLDELVDVVAPAPLPGQILTWDGSQWVPQDADPYTAGPGISINAGLISNTGDLDASDDLTIGSIAGGDLIGNYPDPTVNRIQGRPVSTLAPNSGQALKWNGSAWTPTNDPPSFWEKPASTLYYLGGDVSIGNTNSNGYRFRVDGGGMAVSNPLVGPQDGLFVTANAVAPNYAAVYASNNGTGAAGYFTNPSNLALIAQGAVGFGTNSPATSFEFQTSSSSTSDGFRITNAGAGDAIIKFALGSGDKYTFGIDNSDSDKLKIGFGSSLSSSIGMTLESNGDVGFGTTAPPTDLAVHKTFSGVNAGGSIRYFADVMSNDAGSYETRGTNGIDNVRITTTTNANHGKVVVLNSGGLEKAGMEVNDFGQGVIFGDVKNFRVDHPTQPDKEIWYASLEGPEAAAYLRGTAQLVNGRAEIVFPEHFSVLVQPSSLTIVLTPLSLSSKGLAVMEKSAEGFQVGELMEGAGTYGFDWEVKAVRKGYENFEVVREKRE